MTNKGPYQYYVDMGEGGRGLADVHERLCKGKHSVEKCPRRGGGGGEGSEMCEIMST